MGRLIPGSKAVARKIETPEAALAATDQFYRNQEGFGYDLNKVVRWIETHIRAPKTGRVLDLCCGDGIWSKGFQKIQPRLELFGIDISAGGIEKARQLLGVGCDHFIVGDAEKALPFPKNFFDLIFSRGPGLFNQHDMSHPQAVAVLEMWHEHLVERGLFVSVFASVPNRMGTYTPPEYVVLPYNKTPRDTGAVRFAGGKYHHTTESFQAPFLAARNVDIVSYAHVANQHILVSRRSSC